MPDTVMNALTFSRFGGPEVMECREVPRPAPGADEVLVRMEAIGLNYADIYRRCGNYHLQGESPWIAGYEGAGTVVESRSDLVAVGDRVGLADVPHANAEFVVAPADNAIPLPDGIDTRTAAAVLLQGLTADYLAADSHTVQAGETVLVHAAAGGVGQILTQICRLEGAQVIGLTRGADKLDVIRGSGVGHALLLEDGWVEQVRDLTGGGVDVAYDSVGSTLARTFAATRDAGHVVFYGMSGGDPEPVDPRMLMDTSKSLTGGDLWGYLTSASERRRRSARLFGRILDGSIVLPEPVEYALADGAAAHAFLESGRSAGKVLLIPTA